MREMSVREANQNFSQVIAAAERGETIVVTKNGRPVAKISPQSHDRAGDANGGRASRRSRKACDRSAGRVVASGLSPRMTNTARTKP